MEHIITMLRDGVADVSRGVQSKSRGQLYSEGYDEKGNDIEQRVPPAIKGKNVV